MGKSIAWVTSLALALTALLASSGCSPDRGYKQVANRGSAPSMELLAEIRFLKRRLEKNKDRPSALDVSHLSQAYLRLGRLTANPRDLEMAESLARESIRLSPKFNPDAKVVLARLSEMRHDFEGAITLATAALKDLPSTGEAMGVLVTSHLALGRLEAAAKAADILTGSEPSATTHVLSALVRTAQGRVEEARYLFERAYASQRTYERDERVWTLNMYARFLIERGELGLAKRVLGRASQVYPRHHLSLALEGDLELQRGRESRAVERYQDAFRVSRDPYYLLLLAGARNANGEAAAAAEALREAEALVRKEHEKPGSTDHRLELARILEARGGAEALKEAAGLAEQEVLARPSGETYLVYARVLRKLGRHRQAAQMAQASLRTGWRNADAYFEAAAAWGSLGDVEQSRFYLREALTLQPRHKDSSDAYWALAHAEAQPTPKTVLAAFAR